MIKVNCKDGKYGIIDNGRQVVPICHDNKSGAIQEWLFFECLNTKQKFLEHVRTEEEISNIIENFKKNESKNCKQVGI